MRGTIHAVLAVATLALAGCATGTTGKSMSLEQVPVELSGEPLRYEFDGVSDDLLTAGLGADGLRGPPPGFANPLRPTALELRRRAIYTAYRGLVDVTEAGGFGRFYGPSGGQKIAGREYLLAVKTPDGASTTTVMLQIPTTFDVANPCLVAVASSGSRGIYGAVPTAGATIHAARRPSGIERTTTLLSQDQNDRRPAVVDNACVDMSTHTTAGGPAFAQVLEACS